MQQPAWRHAPNAISAARIAAAPVLAILATSGRREAFTVLLVCALLSDILDGWLARRFALASRLGALLDSVADAALLLVALYGVWRFHPEVLERHRVAGFVLLGATLLEHAVALLRYGRLSSFHTYLSKAAGYALGFCVGLGFLVGFTPALVYAAVGLAVLGTLEELALLAVLPEWRSDVKGLAWVLRERRRAAS